jgi:acetylornithine/succinyldiaminopimelate/putrescine aminotransferase
MGQLSSLESHYGAANYKPLPVTLVRGKGVYVWDEHGRRYLDMMGAYSAVSFGHCHPRLVEAMTLQARRLDTVSRAFSEKHSAVGSFRFRCFLPAARLWTSSSRATTAAPSAAIRSPQGLGWPLSIP